MEGDKVKVTVMFRGREMVHINRGREKLQQVKEMLGTLAKMENPPRMEGRFKSMILIADREVVAEAKRLEELKAGEAGVVEEEPNLHKKAERRAAKQRRADEARGALEDPGRASEEPVESAEAEDSEAANEGTEATE